MPTFRLLVAAIHLGVLSSQAFATTGWDRHQVDVHGRFRIHGANGASFVHRVDANGQIVGAPLCGTLDANGMWNGLGSPPDYAVTRSHIVIRYSTRDSAADGPQHFVIRLSDAEVVGPLAADQLEPAFRDSNLQWTTPVTAAEQFHRAVWFAELGLVVIALHGLGLLLWIGKRFLSVRPKGKPVRPAVPRTL